MNEIINKLKGISCILNLRSLCDEHSSFEWECNSVLLLRNSLNECIKELEDFQAYQKKK